ncbi:MAG: hypothetical protein ACFFCV_19250 [Promethearchaeota archaeon]
MNNIKPLHKFKTYKFDAAPFFFYIEIFPPDLSIFKNGLHRKLLEKINSNPIMPLPMRVDRVFNGEKSLLIRPREPINFSLMDNLTATVNPTSFLQYGFERLLYFTEIRGHENFFVSLNLEKTQNWWNSTKFLYAKLRYLEEDFSAFIRAYIHTVLKAKLNDEDLSSAATEYCQIVSDICDKRLKENSIIIETTNTESNVKLYKEKEAIYRKKGKKVKQIQYHPELVDIDVFDLSEKGFVDHMDNKSFILNELKPLEIKYIPLLFYDDLLECMLQNLKFLNDGNHNILDPSFLLDNNIIVLNESKKKYTWFDNFDNIALEPIIESIKTVKLDYYKSLGNLEEQNPKSTNL